MRLVLQRKKLTEWTSSLAQGHRTSKWQSQDPKPGLACSRARVCLLLLGFWHLLCAAPIPGSSLLSKHHSPATVHTAPALVPSAGLTCMGCSYAWAAPGKLSPELKSRLKACYIVHYMVTPWHWRSPMKHTAPDTHAFEQPLPHQVVCETCCGQQGLSKCDANLRGACVWSLALLEHCHLVDKVQIDLRIRDLAQPVAWPPLLLV